MTAKDNLFVRLQYLSAAVNLPVLVDQGIALDEHNGVANLLRKGLGIVAFNMLEDFIKERSVESLKTLSESGIAFSNLTEYLQESAISGALNALVFRANMQKKNGEDWKVFIQDETLKIHSTKNERYELSKYSLVYGGSNISSNEITDLLKAFGISGGWAKMKSISDSIGGGLPDLNQIFKNAAQRRHSAAHTADFRFEYQWLEGIKKEILAISGALDILLSARCRQVRSNLRKSLDEHNIDDALSYRFLEPSRNVYRETTQIGGKSRKNWASLADAVNCLKPSLPSRQEFLIILDNAKRVDNWYV